MPVEALPVTGVGNAAAPNGWVSAPNNALTLIGDADQDTNFGHVSTNATGTYTQGYEFDDMPLTFLTMTSTLSIQLRYAWSTFDAVLDEWVSLSTRIMSGATVLAASTAGGAVQSIATSITTTTATNSAAISFDYVNTDANRTTWNAAVIEIEITRTKIKGGTTNQQRVFALSVTGDFNALDTTKKYFFIT